MRALDKYPDHSLNVLPAEQKMILDLDIKSSSCMSLPTADRVTAGKLKISESSDVVASEKIVTGTLKPAA